VRLSLLYCTQSEVWCSFSIVRTEEEEEEEEEEETETVLLSLLRCTQSGLLYGAVRWSAVL
jgi:hypothetical protein